MKRRRFVAIALVIAFVSPLQAADAPADISGKWRMVWTVRQGRPLPVHLILELQQVGGTLSGTVRMLADAQTGAEETTVPMIGTVEGNAVLLIISPSKEDPNLRLEFRGRVQDDQMGGTNERGDPWSATHTRPFSAQ